MPLETATYVSDLVTSNPAASDGMNNADDHMRMIKATLKNSFPSISGAVTASHTQINNAVAATLNGVAVLADAGAYFKTNATDGFVNALAGDIDVQLQGVVAATFQRTTGVNFLKVKGALQVDTSITAASITAAGIAPIGSMIMWLSDALPPTSEGVWVWANGLAYSRSTYATAFARMGTAFGAGDGSTTFNVIDMQSVVPVGKNTMGGASGNSILSTVSNALRNALGKLFGTEVETLTTAQIPSHFHAAGISDPGHTHGNNANSGSSTTGGGGFASGGASGASINTATTGIRVNSANGLDTTASAGGGGSHNNLGPSRTVNYIVRLA